VLDAVVLEMFARVINAKLFKTIHHEVFEAKNVQQTDPTALGNKMIEETIGL